MDFNKLQKNIGSYDLENAKLKHNKIKNPPQYEEGMEDDSINFEDFLVGEADLDNFLGLGANSNTGGLGGMDLGAENSTSIFNNQFAQTKPVENPEDRFFRVVKEISKVVWSGVKKLFEFCKNTDSKTWGKYISRILVSQTVAAVIFILLMIFGVKKILFIRTLSWFIFNFISAGFLLLVFGFTADYVNKNPSNIANDPGEKPVNNSFANEIDSLGFDDSGEDFDSLDDSVIDTSFFDDNFELNGVPDLNDLYVPPNFDTTANSNNVESELDSIDTNRFYDREYLLNKYLKILPKYTPDFETEEPLREGTDEFYFIDTSCTKAINAVSTKEVEEAENTYLVEAFKTKMYIRARMRRIKGLNKTDAIARELEPYFKINKKDNVNAVVELWGDFYDIKVFGNENFFVSLGDFLGTPKGREFFTDPNNTFPVILGIDGEGEPIYRDLKNLESLLIAGMPRSGKTWVGLNILTQLSMFTSPEDLQYIILDPKDKTSDFLNFNIPHNIAFCGNSKEFNSILEVVVEQEGKRRQDIIGKYKETSIWDLRNRHPEVKLPIIYVFIDEVVTVAETMGKEEKERFDKLLRILVTKLPNVGIRTVLIPHVAKHQFLNKTIKSVIPFRASVMGNTDHIKSTLDLTTNKFDYVLSRKGDMAMTIGSEEPMFIKSGVITDSNENNKKVFDFIRRLWMSRGYEIESSPALRRVYEYMPDKY